MTELDPMVSRVQFEREVAARQAAENQLRSMAEALAQAQNAPGRPRDGLSDPAQRQMEQLESALNEAVHEHKLQTQFIATMSHELRTPLTSVLGYADLLREEQMPEAERQRHVEVLRRSAEHLLHLIERVFDMAQVDAGASEPRRTETDLPNLLEDLLAPLRPLAEDRQLSLEAATKESIPRFVVADGRWIRQIITCLVDNGLRFTEHGGVVIAAAVRPEGPTAFRLIVDVIDTGIGIHAEDAARIFDPFEQLNDGLDRRWAGPGLGLTFARRFARFLGGDVTLTSEPGQGSTFRVDIPVELLQDTPWIRLGPSGSPRRRSARDAAAGAPLQGTTICVAEDQPEIRFLVRQVLERSGAIVHEAENGQSLFELAMREQPDVVVTDLQMPECDGYTGVRMLRDAEFDRPIIAFTAHGLAEDEVRARAAGCDDYLVKPIDPVALVDTLVRWRGRRHFEVQPPAGPESVDETSDA
ncbi:MAG: response regulator [Phycisphaerales bacterium]